MSRKSDRPTRWTTRIVHLDVSLHGVHTRVAAISDDHQLLQMEDYAECGVQQLLSFVEALYASGKMMCKDTLVIDRSLLMTAKGFQAGCVHIGLVVRFRI